MLDIRVIRQEPERVIESLKRRRSELDLGELQSLDTRFRETQTELDGLRAQKNKVSEEVATLKKAKQDATAVIESMKTVGERIKTLEAEMSSIEAQRGAFMLRIPNMLDASVPDGVDEDDNVEVRKWGELPQFGFAPKPHYELGESLNIIDFERGVKLAGARFEVLRGAGARLRRALLNLMLDMQTTEHGYEEMVPPFVANEETMTANGNLPKFADQLFKLEETKYYLIPTAEIPLTNFHRDEILDEATLPLYFTSGTPCFRSEAGAAGRDTKGMIRRHQFEKVEMVKIVKPETSMDELEKMVANAEAILQRLELPYRTVLLSSGDTGANAAKTYDVEVWFPEQAKYREISSCSNCTDFQARRGNLRYRDAGGKTQHPHTLNGSGLPIGRTLAAILENYQQEDGTIKVPTALVPYMGGLERISRS
ncbi:MAG: seryl-tRNA synthetase [Cyanobacteria bacterium RYN_339]|nr:seryl-tRNA synthetase [Cyanobacteria bacterium RYN_339]